MISQAIHFKKPVLLFLITGFLVSCATHSLRLTPVQSFLLTGNCEDASKSLEELSSKDSKDRLLYLMEYGSALQICKDYNKSNQVFLAADKHSEEIDYISATKVVGATLLNEEMLQYKGDIFERLFINASAALNYIELEQFDDAMVEIRRINEKYNKFSAEEKNSYELNSFSQYLSGLVFEMDQKYDDACISFKTAYNLDKSFRDVGLDMLTACYRAKRHQEFNELVKQFIPTEDELNFIKRKKDKNEKIIIYLQGIGPKKIPRRNDPLYPYLVPNRNIIKHVKITYEDSVQKKSSVKVTQQVYNVEKAAIATQEADYGALVARRFGARIAKEVVADQIRQKNKTLGDVAWLVMVASERADLRSWSLLPETVQIARISANTQIPIKLEALSEFDAELETIGEIDLSQKKYKKIFLIRTIK